MGYSGVYENSVVYVWKVCMAQPQTQAAKMMRLAGALHSETY
jgi:hypothetical protein